MPQNDFTSIVLPHLSKEVYSGKPLVLSSIGRWHGEEPAVMRATVSSGHPMLAVIYLELDEDEVISRWGLFGKEQDRGIRKDDKGESLRIRLKEFRNKTEPVIEFYRSKNMLIEVNGNDAVDVVTGNIIRKLANFARD